MTGSDLNNLLSLIHFMAKEVMVAALNAVFPHDFRDFASRVTITQRVNTVIHVNSPIQRSRA